MIRYLRRTIEKFWYHGRPLVIFWPLTWIFRALIAIRKQCYEWRLLPSHPLPVPVVVVGNITVGGNGKTPLVIKLVESLQKKGYRPGIVLRGYGGQCRQPTLVSAPMDAQCYGDEAVLLATRTNVPVVVAKRRFDGAQKLLQERAVDVIVTDDGLQHYALRRDIEIIVIDESRQFGNGFLLPLGPLREPPQRLKEADFVILHGPSKEAHMQLTLQLPWQLSTGKKASFADFEGRRVHAVAGIGTPCRFFNHLREKKLDIQPHAFADHHAFKPTDFPWPLDEPILMTEKDAVKCAPFAQENMWVVPVNAEVNQAFLDKFILKVIEVSNSGQKTA